MSPLAYHVKLFIHHLLLINVIINNVECDHEKRLINQPFGIDISGDGGIRKRIINTTDTYDCDDTESVTPSNMSFVTVNYV